MVRQNLIQYSIIHFLVDFACIVYMYRTYPAGSAIFAYYLLYNFMAFAMQMPCGLIADYVRRNVKIAGVGCGLLAVVYGIDILLPEAVACGILLPYLMVTFLGLGNCLFHVGAGTAVLNLREQKIAPLGIFISPGALGIYLGTFVNSKSILWSIMIALILLIAAAWMIASEKTVHIASDDDGVSFQYAEYGGRIRSLICIFFVVVLRAYLSGSLIFTWKNAFYTGMIAVSVVLGKMIGGIAADTIGVKKVSIISLGLSSILFGCSSYPLAGILAVFFFNMTMPITLSEAKKCLPKSKGFSFGLLTFALFTGYLCGMIPQKNLWNHPVEYTVLTMVSLVLLYLGLKQEVFDE